MDFRSCPSCKASVLEEDAVECPFCGASMSGKPTPVAPKTAPPKAVPPQQSPSRPSETRPAGRSSSTARSSPQAGGAPRPTGARPPGAAAKPPTASQKSDDDPFDVDTSAVRQAIKLAPRVMKGRTYEVICPMCETPGYMLPSDVGKDVHCCNPDCMVPVFKSKKPVVQSEDQPKTGSQKPVIIAASLAGILLVGLGIWAFQPKSSNHGDDDSELGAQRQVDSTNVVPTHDRIVQDRKDPTLSMAELKKLSLAAILDRARQRERNRNIEYGYQQAAETFAAAGDLKLATEQLQRLQAGSAGLAHLQLQPMVAIGWAQLASGQKDSASATALDAFGRVQNLPKSVRNPLDSCVALAALLVATGNQTQANSLISQEQDRSVRGTVSTNWRAAVESGSYNYNDESRFVWHLAMPEPMRLGAVEALVCHQQSALALSFAGSGSSPASQSLCRAAWAARLTQINPAQARTQIQSAIEQGGFDQATQALVWASVADMEFYLKNSAGTKTALDLAKASLSQVEQPAVQRTPSKKEIHDSEGKPHFGLADPAPAYVAAMAAAGVGIVQLHVSQPDLAWSNLEKAMDCFKGVSPSSSSIQNLLDELARSEASVRSELSTALGIPLNDDRLRRAFNRYRQQLQNLNAFTQERINSQVSILKAVAEVGDYQRVWEYALSRVSVNDDQLRHNYLESSLPSLIQALAEADGNSAVIDSVRGSFSTKPLTVDPLDQVYATTFKRMRENDLKGAASIFESAYRSRLAQQHRDALDAIAMQVVGELQSKGTVNDTVRLTQGLYDEMIQENLFLLITGYAAKNGTVSDLWHLMNHSAREYQALEFVSLYRGVVEAINKVQATDSDKK